MVKITGVPETMFQTLYARAKESQKPNPLFYDSKAVEIVGKLDYDFSIADKDKMMNAVVTARTLLLDRMVTNYLDSHPDSVIINLACGMDTRFSRMDNGILTWYDLDLPEIIALRKHFFSENERVSMISASAMDEQWTNQVTTQGRPVLVILEGVTMYLTEQEVKTILAIIYQNFNPVTLFMEVMSPFAVKRIKGKSIEASHAEFTWGVKSGRQIEQLVPGLSYLADYNIAETMPQVYAIFHTIGRIPFIHNMLNKITVFVSFLQ